MKRFIATIRGAFTGWPAAGFWTPWILGLTVVSWANAQSVIEDLLSVGHPGPSAVTFKVWTNKKEGESFHSGDRAIIYLNADQKAYVTLLAVSAESVVTVILPNRFMPDTMIQPQKLYELFGDDSPLRVVAGEWPHEDKLLICLSSIPLTLEPLAVPAGSAFLTLTDRTTREIQILKEKLRTIAAADGFNRAIISLRGETGADLKIKLIEDQDSSAPKRIPTGQESSPPETLTGSAGRKPLPEGKQER